MLLFGRNVGKSSVECGRARSNACVWIAGARQWRSAATQLVSVYLREGSGEPSRPRTHRGVAARPGRPFVETRDGRIIVGRNQVELELEKPTTNLTPRQWEGASGGSLGLQSRP